MRTMADKVCEYYEDLFATYPPGASEEERKGFDDANRKRVKFFRAVRYLLKNRFAFPADIPAPPHVPLPKKEDAENMLQGLDDGEKAYFLAVAGILLANNLTDPLAGKIEGT